MSSKSHSEQYKLLVKDNSLKQLGSFDANSITEIPEESIGAYPDDIGSENNSINIIHSRNVMYNPKKKGLYAEGAKSLNTDRLEKMQASTNQQTSTNNQSSALKLPKIGGVADSRLNIDSHDHDSGSMNQINSPLAARSYRGQVFSNHQTPNRDGSYLRTPKPMDIIRMGSVQDQYLPQSPIKRGPLAYSKIALKRRGTVLQNALNKIQDMPDIIDSTAVSQINSNLHGLSGTQAKNTLDSLVPISTTLDRSKRSQTVQKSPVRETGKIHVGPGSVATISHKFQIERKIQEFKNEKSKVSKLETDKNALKAHLKNHPIKAKHLTQTNSPFANSINDRDLSFNLNDEQPDLEQSFFDQTHNLKQDYPLQQTQQDLLLDKQSEEMFRKFMKVHELKKNEARDLTSKKLADQATEHTSKEDAQYAAAFLAFKKTLMMKYPDGSIPKKQLKQFHLDVKRNYFKRQLEDQLFRVVFRDTEFMKAVDRSVKIKDKYQTNIKNFRPQNKYVQDEKVVVVSQGMKDLHAKFESGEQKPLNNGQNSLERKIGPAFNTEKLSFQPEDYFLKKKSQLKKGLVKGGGGAKYNQVKAEIERKKRRLEQPSTIRKKSPTYRDEPTLDRKGRINDGMYQFYPGLYNIVQSKIAETSLESQKEIQDRVFNIVKEVNLERAPQNSSKSQSPYLLANSFTFDVTEILKEVKASQTEKANYETYNELTREELQKLLDRKSGKIHKKMTEWEQNRPNSRAGLINQRIDALGETTDEIEEIIIKILKERDIADEILERQRKLLKTPRKSSKLGLPSQSNASRNSSRQNSAAGSRKSSQLRIHEQVIEEKTIEKKRARIAPEPNSKLLERMERIAGKFADEAVVILDKTSPFKIRGDQIMQESEQIDKKIEEMDIHQFLREIEMSMLRDAQIIREMEAGMFDNEEILSQLNNLDEIEQSKNDKPLNLEKISSRKGKSSLDLTKLSSKRGKSNLNIIESKTDTRRDVNQDTQFTKYTHLTGQQTGMKTGTTNRDTKSLFQTDKPAKKKKKQVDDEDMKFSAMKVTKQIKLRHKGLMTEIQKEIDINSKFFESITEGEQITNKERINYLKKEHEREIKVREANVLREFKKSKQGLLQQLLGTGQKKQKAVDLSLGSEATMFVEDSRQNKRILERLVEQAQEQNKKIQEMGMNLDEIKEEFAMKREETQTDKLKIKSQNQATKLTSSLRKGKQELEPYSPDGIKKLKLGQKIVSFEQPLKKIQIQLVSDGSMTIGDNTRGSQTKELPEINDDLISQFASEYTAKRAKEKEDAENAPSPDALSPIKNTLRTKEQIKMVNDRLASAVHDIDSELSNPHTVMIENQEVQYLPLARTKKNPNSRGGAIFIEPKAPTIRLDSTLQKIQSPKKYEKLELYDILADLEIIEVPKVGDGKPITSKRVQKPMIEECLRSVILFQKVEQRKPNADGEMFQLNPDLLKKLSSDRLIRMYIFERVSTNVEDAVHKRVISDTIKMQNFDLNQKLQFLERKLFEEAKIQELDVKKIREEVDEEFKSWQKELDKFQKSPNKSQLQLKLNLEKSSLSKRRKSSQMVDSISSPESPSILSEASKKSEEIIQNLGQKKKPEPKKFTSRLDMKNAKNQIVVLPTKNQFQKQQNLISKKAEKRKSFMKHGIPKYLLEEMELNFENQEKMNHYQLEELTKKFGWINQDKFLDFNVNDYYESILLKKSQREIEETEKRKQNIERQKRNREMNKFDFERRKQEQDEERKQNDKDKNNRDAFSQKFLDQLND